MRRIPLFEWRAQAAAQLMDESLSQQGHGHLSQANMQVEGTGAFPTQVLVEAEELFDVPAVRKIASQGRHLGTSAGASEAFEVVVLGLLSGALNVAIARRGRGSAAGDRKSTRLNSSHLVISYAVFCLKKKKTRMLL